MSKWGKWHMELKDAVDKPNQEQLTKMEKKHFELYSLYEKIKSRKEELEELEERFNDLKGTLNIKKLPNWAWVWMKKHSRVAWKQEFINRLGKTKANEVSAQAKTKEHPQIGIQFIDPNPDKIPIDPKTKELSQKPKRLNLSKKKKTPLLKLKVG